LACEERLGHTARALLIVGEKGEHAAAIDTISHERRFEGTAPHRVKWITEISHPVDSRRNTMIQLSDLIALCVRGFLEIDRGHRRGWRQEARNFYATAYDAIDRRAIRREIVERPGREANWQNVLLGTVQALPLGQWRRRYEIRGKPVAEVRRNGRFRSGIVRRSERDRPADAVQELLRVQKVQLRRDPARAVI
jgi:hypothetical protein